MRNVAKSLTIVAAVGLSAQPCLAAGAESSSTPVAATVASAAAEYVDFDLGAASAQAAAVQKPAGQLPLATAVSANAAIAAQEADEQERRGMSKGAKTALIVGGAVLVGVLILGVVVASSVPPTL